jgi:hypothetical protein
MIHRNCRSLLRFGAVAAALLLALPALADEIEPEPSVEEDAAEPEAEPAVNAEVAEKGEAAVAKPRGRDFDQLFDQLFDLLILRPVGLVTTIVGGVFFVPAALLVAPTGAERVQDAWAHFVAPSVERTFKPPLGGEI